MEFLGADLLATRRFADARPEILRGLSAGYAGVTDEQASTLATRFGLRYWIAPNDRPSAYARVFATDRLAVLALPEDR